MSPAPWRTPVGSHPCTPAFPNLPAVVHPPPPCRIPSRSAARRLAAVVAAGLLVLGLPGCSSDGNDDGARADPSSTTEAAGRSTTTAADRATTTVPATTTTTAGVPVLPPGATRYAGPVDGQQAGVEVSFTRDGAITDFEVGGLSMDCQPLTSGEPSTRSTTVSIAEVAVSASGAVSHIEEDARYRPSLTGSFTPDGSFAGGLYLSGEDDGFVCGGEFTFIAAPT
ncbi:MAG: hypothetical protein JWM47_2407 [Acidimicrobiales bacterium]|nr:hypothetical protein [Acidimicrobiales bacterium]